MAAAVVEASIWTGASPTFTGASPTGAASAETGGGIVWNREDSKAGTTPVPIPTATGTNYSWLKNLGLRVTTAGTTTITDRYVRLASAATTGLYEFWKALASASYAQAAAGNMPAAGGTNGAVPAGYTAMTTSPVSFDATDVATTSQGLNGGLCVCLFGVGFDYTGGAGAAIALPNLILSYDEA